VEHKRDANLRARSFLPTLDRAATPWITYPPYWALREKTVNVGLRRAGFPEE